MGTADNAFFQIRNKDPLRLQILRDVCEILTVPQKRQMRLRSVKDPVSRRRPECYIEPVLPVQFTPRDGPAVRDFHAAPGVVPAVSKHVFQIIIDGGHIAPGALAEKKQIAARGPDTGILILHFRTRIFSQCLQCCFGEAQKDAVLLRRLRRGQGGKVGTGRLFQKNLKLFQRKPIPRIRIIGNNDRVRGRSFGNHGRRLGGSGPAGGGDAR